MSVREIGCCPPLTVKGADANRAVRAGFMGTMAPCRRDGAAGARVGGRPSARWRQIVGRAGPNRSRASVGSGGRCDEPPQP